MSRITQNLAAIAPAVERVIGNDEVTGSNPVGGTNQIKLLLNSNFSSKILRYNFNNFRTYTFQIIIS